MSNMTRVAVLDDWQGVARGAPIGRLQRRAEVVFFSDALLIRTTRRHLADFDIVLSMRERDARPVP